jgi:hypothetical protein
VSQSDALLSPFSNHFGKCDPCPSMPSPYKLQSWGGASESAAPKINMAVPASGFTVVRTAGMRPQTCHLR